MPPNTRKSKVIGVENHSMVLRKHRQSSFLPPTSQRKPFNEIGNVVRRDDARASISVDFLKNGGKTIDSKPTPPSRKSYASRSSRQSMSLKASEPEAVECNPARRSVQVHLATLVPPSSRLTIEKPKNKPLEHISNLLPPPMAPPLTTGHAMRKCSAVVATKRVPRLTLKPTATPPENHTTDNKRRESIVTSCNLCHPLRRLTLKPAETIQADTIPASASTKFESASGKHSTKARRKKKSRLHINSKDDIDLMHQGCPWMVSAYASHIYSYLQELEIKLAIRKSIINVPLVTEEIRATMVEWLACIYHQLRLLQETYLLSVSLLDRYLMGTKNIVETDKLQLVALICLCLGIKFEEAIPGSIKEMLKLTKDTYSKEQFLKMEADVVQVLDFQICRPVSITFLRRFNLAARCDRVQHTYGKYLIDLAQLDKALAYERPSCLAAAAVFVGMCITKSEANSQYWNPVLCHYTSFNFQEIQPVVSRMATMAINGGGHHSSIRKKYSSETNYRVAEKVGLQWSMLQKLR